MRLHCYICYEYFLLKKIDTFKKHKCKKVKSMHSSQNINRTNLIKYLHKKISLFHSFKASSYKISNVLKQITLFNF